MINGKVSASLLIDLKNKINDEIARRSLSEGILQNQSVGSLSSVNTNDYPLSPTPSASSPVKASHYTNTMTLASKINSSTFNDTTRSPGELITDFPEAINTKVNTLVAQGVNSSSHGCNANCTGLCATGCYGTCSSCSSTCTNTCLSCTGTCVGGCSSCTGTCTGSCTSCSGSCAGGCQGCSSCTSCNGCSGCSSCSGSCSGTCTDACTSCSSCSGSCTGSCSGCHGCGPCTGCYGCTGCGSSCSSSCTGSCTGICSASCSHVSV